MGRGAELKRYAAFTHGMHTALLAGGLAGLCGGALALGVPAWARCGACSLRSADPWMRRQRA